MGNSLTHRIKHAVVNYDSESLQALLQNSTVRSYDGVNVPLNRKRDGALSLAIRLARYELIPVILDAGGQVCHYILYDFLFFSFKKKKVLSLAYHISLFILPFPHMKIC